MSAFWDAFLAQRAARAVPALTDTDSTTGFDFAVSSFMLHSLAPDAQQRLLEEALRARQALVLVDYCLVERNLYYPAAGVAFLMERCAGGGHFQAYRAFMRAGALFGLCARLGLVPARHVPVLGGLAAALLIHS